MRPDLRQFDVMPKELVNPRRETLAPRESMGLEGGIFFLYDRTNEPRYSEWLQIISLADETVRLDPYRLGSDQLRRELFEGYKTDSLRLSANKKRLPNFPEIEAGKYFTRVSWVPGEGPRMIEIAYSPDSGDPIRIHRPMSSAELGQMLLG